MKSTLAILTMFLATPAVAQDANELAFFEEKIRPVLIEHCYKCHASDARIVRGGLLLDSRDGIRKGGDSGPAVVPGKLDESLLISSLKYEDYEMPPSGQLPASVIADFEKWIAMGAADPRDGKSPGAANLDVETGRSFWSFQPPKMRSVPEVRNQAWPRGDIDRFTLSAMEDRQLSPADDAGKTVLLRRAYFDLIGLPPTSEQIDAFLKDKSGDAFERVVDELLASRHFGEQWGRHWLDLARYSDSTGGGRSLLFNVAWRYRNYVIESLNRDTPFNQFVVEQIAGDLMNATNNEDRARQLTATGFLALGPTNYENQDKRQLRMDVVDEQIDTIGRAFLGMTIGCARCHDHKFDPIPTKDYYALAGVFRSTRSLIDGNVSKWVTRSLPAEEASNFAAEIKATEKALSELKNRLAELNRRIPATTLDDNQAKLTGKWKESTFTKGFRGKHYIHTSDRSATATYTFGAPGQAGLHEVLVSYTAGDNREPKTPVVVRQGTEVVGSAVVNQRADEKGRFVSLGQYQLEKQHPVSVTIAANGTSQVVIADAIQLRFIDGAEVPALLREVRRVEEESRQLTSKLAELGKRSAQQPLVLSVEEEKEPADFHVCVRGNVRRLGEKVPRGVLSVAASQPVLIPTDASGRLEVAKWIASSENPLTARVAVNRIWHHLFGSGIVRTVDNFGVPGEKPSNLQLLDYLALRFIDCDWSVKGVIREIVLSRTYQQSSMAGDKQLKRDPENRWFARQNRRRLQVESLRDALYLLSGELDLSVAQDTIRPGTTSGYGYKFSSNYRSVYLPVFRNRLHPMFAVFDFPDPNLSNGRRNVSTLSTQALYLMNSELVQSHAAKAADRLLADSNLTDTQRLNLLYKRAVGREPSYNELQLAVAFLQSDVGERTEKWASVCQAVIGSVDFRYMK